MTSYDFFFTDLEEDLDQSGELDKVDKEEEAMRRIQISKFNQDVNSLLQACANAEAK